MAGLAAFCAGAFWGAIPGYLRARRGSHEVINTIMLNFIAAGLASYVTLHLLKNPDSQAPESSAIGAGYRITQLGWFPDTPLSTALFLALFAAFLVWIFLWKTVPGFELRAVGQNEDAARKAGIRPAYYQILALTLGGGLAGLVGVAEVLGNAGRFKMEFSPGYGFLGIAVALLGKNRPLGVVAAAVLFGALHKGTADLDMETENITRDLSQILQAFIILAVAAEGLWDWMREKKGVVT
jgi:simple sugar transport system permease protein